MVAVGAKLIVEPVAPNYRVEDLLANVTPEAMRGDFIFIKKCPPASSVHAYGIDAVDLYGTAIK